MTRFLSPGIQSRLESVPTLQILLCLLLLAAPACGASRQTRMKVITPEDDNSAAGRGLAENVKIYTYTAPADGFFASSHYIVTPDGVLLFDTQFLPEYAEELWKQMRRHSKAPLSAIYITHPHPDHYFGTAHLLSKGPVGVFSTEAITRHIQIDGYSKLLFWRTGYGDRLPATLKVPELTFTGRSSAGVGGVVLELREVGLNESSTSLIAWMPRTRALITGDLVFQGSHLWMAEGHSDEWIQALEAMKAYEPRWVYPGHGAPGGPDLLTWNQDYLRTVQQAARRHRAAGDKELSPEQLEAIRQEVLSAYPGLANPGFLDLSIPAEVNRQTASVP